MSLLLALFLAACSESHRNPESARLTYSIDTLGSAVTVTSEGAAPRWSVDTLLKVGAEGGMASSAPDEFGEVVSAVPDDSGRLWVADAQNHEVKAFSRDGELVVSVGREGQGPGEFRSLQALAIVGDRLLVLDFGNGRVAEFTLSGEWLGARTTAGGISGLPSLLRFYAVSDSQAYQWSMKAHDGRSERTWVEHGPAGVTGEMTQLHLEPPEPTHLVCERSDGGTMSFRMPFGGQVFEYPTRDRRVYVTWSANYRIDLVSPNGDTIKVVQRRRNPVPVSDADWDSATAEIRQFHDEWPGAKCEPGHLDRPAFKAPIVSLLIDTEQRLWVETSQQDGTAWEIFEPDGRLVGSLPGFSYDERVAPTIRDSLLVWVDRNELGLQSVYLARIQPRTLPRINFEVQHGSGLE